ncbi:hypothetical protein SISSUDRAFT_343294 [Sistotremastrum suecicum HHB10207 ss-3]|uniref:Uncharacterized protein n=1 Tax=Sistotremastrum suecicum HHB10207 ss-3 TaxID=1314776 RepID=A0A166IZC7_9AGAM|nr:hypothetical protein SISSUDRAFT_343294 [Sistotremastrum suecicum HHB10207 ss-3]
MMSSRSLSSSFPSMSLFSFAHFFSSSSFIAHTHALLLSILTFVVARLFVWSCCSFTAYYYRHPHLVSRPSLIILITPGVVSLYRCERREPSANKHISSSQQIQRRMMEPTQ